MLLDPVRLDPMRRAAVAQVFEVSPPPRRSSAVTWILLLLVLGAFGGVAAWLLHAG